MSVLADVSTCLAVLKFFLDKRALMKANWSELGGLMARCGLCAPLLEKIISNQADPRYSSKLTLMGPNASEPCIVTFKNLLQAIDAFHEDFTKSSILKGMKRIAFTKSYAAQIVAFEQQRTAIMGILQMGEALDNDARRQIDHDEFENKFHQRIEEICDEIGDAREENKANLANILAAVESSGTAGEEEKAQILSRLRTLKESLQEVLEAQQADKEAFLAKMDEQQNNGNETRRVLQQVIDQGKAELDAKLEEANAALSEQMRGMQAHASQELQGFGQALEASVSSISLEVRTLIDAKFEAMTSSLARIEESMGRLEEGFHEVLARLSVDKRAELLRDLQLSLADLILGQELNVGGFGSVFVGTFKRNKVAIKVLCKQNGAPLKKHEKEAAEDELLITRHLTYPVHNDYILLCYGFVHDVNRTMLVLELAKFGSLWDLLDDEEAFPSIPFTLSVVWLRDVAEALAHIHGKSIVHKDVKAQNLLLFDGLRLKICDFGLSKQSDLSGAKSVAGGTPVFMSPEVAVHGQHSTPASDMFSFGVTALQVLSRRSPQREDMAGQIARCCSSNEVIRQIITRAVATEPQVRPLAREVAAALDQALHSLDPRSDASAPEYTDVSKIEEQARVKAGIAAELQTRLLVASSKVAESVADEVDEEREEKVEALVAWLKQNVPDVKSSNRTKYANSFYDQEATSIARVAKKDMAWLLHCGVSEDDAQDIFDALSTVGGRTAAVAKSDSLPPAPPSEPQAVIVEQGDGGGEATAAATATAAAAATAPVIAVKVGKVGGGAAAAAAAARRIERYRMPNKDKKDPNAGSWGLLSTPVNKQVYEAAKDNDVNTLERLGREWAGNEIINEYQGMDGQNALIVAAAGGHVESVRVLIAAGADLEATEWNGFTALHTAAYYGKASVCRILIDEGAALSKTTTSSGETALMIARARLPTLETEAVRRGKTQIVTMLEAAGAR